MLKAAAGIPRERSGRAAPRAPNRPISSEASSTPAMFTKGQRHMATDFDRFAQELEQKIIEEARATYSAKVVEEFYNPKNLGRMPEPDVHGLVDGWCGDTMEIYLRLDGERIKETSFVTDGCAPSVACGSMLTTMIRGMSLEEAGEVRPEDLLEALGGLPQESAHCAELAVSTLQNALFNWRGAERRAGKGWKRVGD